MRRADRLFQIIQRLRRRRTVVKAAELAEALEVSERTIYRDVRDLIANGTPIEGEAGVGYRLRPEFDLPPLMFDRDEIQALVLGARIVQSFGDPALKKASASVLSKVRGVLPKDMLSILTDTALYAPSGGFTAAVAPVLGTVREALQSHHKLRFAYQRADGKKSRRTVRPLGAFFWGRSWSLTAWCELRRDFRNFRFDRIDKLEMCKATFQDEPGRTLQDWLGTMGPGALKLLDNP